SLPPPPPRSTLSPYTTLFRSYTMLCASITAQMAALEALKNGEADMEEMVAQYDERRRLVVNGFRAIGMDCFEPQGAFYAFPSVRSEEHTSELQSRFDLVCRLL